MRATVCAAVLVLTSIDSSLWVLMRWTRTIGASRSGEYAPSVAVLCAEAMKLVLSAALATREVTWREAVDAWYCPSSAKMLFPAFLYLVQNNMQYVAATHLDAAVLPVLYQLKIVTTSFFSILLLGRRYTQRQWTAIALCAVGAALVQYSSVRRPQGTRTSSEPATATGLGAVAVSIITSGLAGAYTELVFKEARSNVWVRNVQLAAYSLVLGVPSAYVRDGAMFAARGVFSGFTPAVWWVVGLVSFGGLVCALVVKLTDSIVKLLAAALSVVTSCFVSALVFGFRPTVAYALGAPAVVTAAYLYAVPLDDDMPPGHVLSDAERHSCAPAVAAAVLVALAVSSSAGCAPRLWPTPALRNDDLDLAAFVVRAVGDTPPPHRQSRLVLYGATLTEDNSPAVVNGLDSLCHLYPDAVVAVNNVTNAKLARPINTMVDGSELRVRLETRLRRRGVKPPPFIIFPWQRSDINTLTEMDVLVAWLRAAQPPNARLVVVSTAFHLPRAFLSALTAADALSGRPISVYAHAGPPLPWAQHAVHSQGELTGTRQELLVAEMRRIRTYIAKGDLLPPGTGLARIAARDQLDEDSEH